MIDLEACVRAALLAPSIHNSQPWRFRIRRPGDGPGCVDVLADDRRRLDVIDPEGRQLVVSVGAALLNLRLAIHHSGRSPLATLCPSPSVLATVEVDGPADPDPALVELATAIPRRHTNRLPFLPDPVPPALIDELVAAAAAESATLRAVPEQVRGTIGRLVRAAEAKLREEGVYRAELGEWARHRTPPHPAVPWHAAETMPLRDFGLVTPHLGGGLDPSPVVLVLSTHGDSTEHWLRAGQALQRVWLTAVARGLALAPMSQPLDIPALRRLVIDPDTGEWAQVLLLLGYAPPTAPTPRRDLSAVLEG